MNTQATQSPFLIHSPFVCLLLFLLLAGPTARAASLSATLSPPTVMEGQPSKLSLTYEGLNPQQAPTLPQVDGLVFNFVGPSSNTTISNRQVQSQIILNFSVTATQPGLFVIPAITHNVNGLDLTTSPLQLRVVKEDPSLINQYAFLKLVIPKRVMYLGETIPVDMMLYVTQAEDLQYPRIESEGFTFSKPVEAGERTRVRMGSSVYNVVSFRVAATAIKKGKIDLGPAECALTLLIQSQGSGRRNMFDPFTLFNQRYERRSITLQSDALPIEIREIPTEGRPDDFTGLIGQFNWNVRSSPHELKEGDPITIQIEISGTGNLSTWEWPMTEGWEAFKFYPPQVHFQALDGLGISNKRDMEQVVIPLDETLDELPEIEWSYFDPENARYERLHHPSQPIRITPTDKESEVMVMTPQTNQQTTQEDQTGIGHIKSKPGRRFHPGSAWPHPFGFAVVTGFPALFWMGTLGFLAYQRHKNNNPRRLRKTRTDQIIRQGFEDLERLAATNDNQAFHAALFRMLQERLGEKMNLPSSAITESILDDPRIQAQAPGETVKTLHELFQKCHEARYAQGSKSGQLKEELDKIKNVFEEAARLPEA